jgi:hypothetical protein
MCRCVAQLVPLMLGERLPKEITCSSPFLHAASFPETTRDLACFVVASVTGLTKCLFCGWVFFFFCGTGVVLGFELRASYLLLATLELHLKPFLL